MAKPAAAGIMERVPVPGFSLSLVEMTDLFPANDPPPVPPSPPDPGDCCGGGCVHCVYDLYDTALERYQAAREAWLLRHPETPPTDDACEP